MQRVVRCPHCRRDVQAPGEPAGKLARCTHCGKTFVFEFAGSEPAPAAEVRPSVCPVCGAAPGPSVDSCIDCGYLPNRGPANPLPDEPAPNICPNPACGVANPPGARICERCTTPLPAPTGQLLAGKYRIDRQIAAGGFGIVYLGHDLQNNRPIAVKEMIGADKQEFAIRKTFFHREAAILEHLQAAPIVPRLYEYLDGESDAFLVMEFIPGRNLLEVLEQPGQKPFPVAAVAGWGARICEVLELMHGRQPAVVHRDLKPDNIMLLPDGHSIRLIDFGTARTMGRHGPDRHVSRTKVFTEGYAPPEQVIGRAEPRSDLFALAGTMYHLVTGQSPEGTFTGRDLTLRLQMPNCDIAEKERWFYELLAINLSESPADRYLSARELRVDLEKRSLTREIVCGRCSKANKVREPYCQACAAPLTNAGEICRKCFANNRLGCHFCISCGHRICA